MTMFKGACAPSSDPQPRGAVRLVSGILWCNRQMPCRINEFAKLTALGVQRTIAFWPGSKESINVGLDCARSDSSRMVSE
jgi:hypothetical protein